MDSTGLSHPWTNLLACIDIPLLIVGDDFRLQGVNPTAMRVLSLTEDEVGRPLGFSRLSAELPELETLVRETMRTLVPQQREVWDKKGRSLFMRLRPYRSMDDHVEGVVVALSEVDPENRNGKAQKAPEQRPVSGTEAKREVKPGAARSLKVLIVEDHADTASLLERYLRSRGHVAITAHDLLSAIEIATAEGGRFDLVLSDLGLPDGSGLDLMRKLRARYGLLGVCLSGYSSAEDMRNSKEAGFIEHLIKPVNLAKLDAVFARLSAL